MHNSTISSSMLTLRKYEATVTQMPRISLTREAIKQFQTLSSNALYDCNPSGKKKEKKNSKWAPNK